MLSGMTCETAEEAMSLNNCDFFRDWFGDWFRVVRDLGFEGFRVFRILGLV